MAQVFLPLLMCLIDNLILSFVLETGSGAVKGLRIVLSVLKSQILKDLKERQAGLYYRQRH